MTLTALLIFAGALAVAAASPGPTITALVARVLARGTSGAIAFMLGLTVAELIWLAAAVLGLAFVARTLAFVFMLIKYAGAAYLLYLAWRMWTAPVKPEEGTAPKPERPMRLFLGAMSLNLGNPKIMLFYLALLPNLIDLNAVTVTGYLELAAVLVLVLTLVDGSYVLLAGRVRTFFRSARAMRLVNRGSGAVMAGAAVAIATR